MKSTPKKVKSQFIVSDYTGNDSTVSPQINSIMKINGKSSPKKRKSDKFETFANVSQEQERKKKKQKLTPGLMSAVDFLSGGFDDIDENSLESAGGGENMFKQKSRKLKKEQSSHQNDENESSGPEEEEVSAVSSHKSNLNKLKEVDPEFYKYLEENDQDLLNFEESEDSDDEDGLHKPPEKLEVASDESDFEEEDQKAKDKSDFPSEGKVTLKMVAHWRERLRVDTTTKTLRLALDAFHAALQLVSHESDKTPCQFQVEGAAVFNAILRLCVGEIQGSLRLILKIPAGSKKHPTQCKAWVKVRGLLMAYLLDLTQLCQVTSPDMLRVLLKHVHQMLPYAVCFPSISVRLLSRLVSLWVMDSEVVRVLSFLCLLRVANLKRKLLTTILKKMYIAFVKNSKFVSPTTVSGINFLRQSLAEMFALDPVVSYQHAFLYIRQLSVHLRNAVTLNKKESFQTVHNWQFVQSLHLWCDLFALIPEDSPLAGLIYPTVQIAIGTIKLIPSAQYYPLRFHCLKFLLDLVDKRDLFIPIIPLALEVLTDFDYNRSSSKVSMKPMDLSCILRCSKAQMQENGFKDAIVESAYAILLGAFASESHRVNFPDTVVPAVIQLKKFLKTCRVHKYCKQVKTLLDKVQENSKFIEQERSKANVRLDDKKGVAGLEASIRAKGTPVATYYEAWRKLHLQQLARKTANTEAIVEYKLPTINKKVKKKVIDEGPVELFPSDDDSADELPFLEKAEKPKKVLREKKKKTPKKEPTIELPAGWGQMGDEDIIEDLNISDLD